MNPSTTPTTSDFAIPSFLLRLLSSSKSKPASAVAAQNSSSSFSNHSAVSCFSGTLGKESSNKHLSGKNLNLKKFLPQAPENSPKKSLCLSPPSSNSNTPLPKNLSQIGQCNKSIKISGGKKLTLVPLVRKRTSAKAQKTKVKTKDLPETVQPSVWNTLSIRKRSKKRQRRLSAPPNCIADSTSNSTGSNIPNDSSKTLCSPNSDSYASCCSPNSSSIVRNSNHLLADVSRNRKFESSDVKRLHLSSASDSAWILKHVDIPKVGKLAKSLDSEQFQNSGNESHPNFNKSSIYKHSPDSHSPDSHSFSSSTASTSQSQSPFSSVCDTTPSNKHRKSTPVSKSTPNNSMGACKSRITSFAHSDRNPCFDPTGLSINCNDPSPVLLEIGDGDFSYSESTTTCDKRDDTRDDQCNNKNNKCQTLRRHIRSRKRLFTNDLFPSDARHREIDKNSDDYCSGKSNEYSVIRDANGSQCAESCEEFSVFGTLATSKQTDYDDKTISIQLAPGIDHSTEDKENVSGLCDSSKTSQISKPVMTLFDRNQSQLKMDALQIFAKMGISAVCKKGLKAEGSNQDTFFVIREREYGLYGVFDGHGPNGHQVSNFVAHHLHTIIKQNVEIVRDPSEAIRMSFLQVNNALKTEGHLGSFDVSLSGSTATVVYVPIVKDKDKLKLIVAHVGDSRAVLCRRLEGNTDNSIQYSSVDLTVDHKPNARAEFARILRAGGQVKRLEGDIPHRVFVKGQMYPGLAMSRALGDEIVSNSGVTCEPDVSEFEVSKGVEKFFLIGSDGVWEFLSSDEAVTLVTESLNDYQGCCQDAAENLALESRRRWIKEEGCIVDDITAEIIMLDTHFR